MATPSLDPRVRAPGLLVLPTALVLSLSSGCASAPAPEASAGEEPLTFVAGVTLTSTTSMVDDELGASVAIDGAWAAVGAPEAETDGRVYLFQRDAGTWVPRGVLADSDGRPEGFGRALAMSGDTLAVGAPQTDTPSFGDAGQVSVFRQTVGGDWALEQEIVNPAPAFGEAFGRSVALVGDLLVVGAPSDRDFVSGGGAVHVYERTGSTWSRTATLGSSTLTSNDGLGGSVATDGTRIVAGATRDDDGTLQYDGSVFVYGRTGGSWAEQAHLRATERNNDDYLGESVAIAGTTVVAGASGADDNTTNPFASEARGYVYVFEESAGVWSQTQRIKPVDPLDWGLFARFGGAVAMTRNIIVVGADAARSGGVERGAAYVLERGPGGFTQTALQAGEMPFDELGTSVAIDLVGAGARVLLGAPGGGTGGLAYVYDLTDPLDLGEACSDAATCASGLCVDGVCCDTACGGGASGDCVACSVASGAATDGTCATVSSTRVCRPSAGACDREERCDGVASTCPSDALEPGGAVCRASVGGCDPEEQCDGESPVCPANDVRPDGASCDNGAACDGTSDLCVAGACSGSLPPSCDDSDPCTADACEDSGGCSHEPVASCVDAGAVALDAATVTPDAGTPGPDAPTLADASVTTPLDAFAAERRDAGATATPASSGCGCRVPTSGPERGPTRAVLWLALLALASARRRARPPCRS